MSIEDSTYMQFIELCLKLCSFIPLWSSKYSKRTYNNHQLLCLIVFKQKLKIGFRDLIEDLRTRQTILDLLKLDKLPDESTLRKFLKRLDNKIPDYLLSNSINLTKKKKLETGIDSTGYHLEDGSYYYRERMGKGSKTRKNLKLSIVTETDKQLILTANVRKSSAHDNKDFIPLIRKTAKIKPIKIVSADKAYDAEENYRPVIKELKAKAAIPQRDYGTKRIPGNRRYRNKAKREFNEREYHQRSKVETINFVMKRLFGAVVYAKKWIMQKKELLVKCIAYNIHRLVVIRRISA